MQPAQKMEESMARFPTIDDLEVKGKRVLVRMDLNVPMRQGKVSDETRVRRQLPTLKDLIARGARVIIISHFGRPKGKFEPSLSLAPLVDVLADLLGQDVKFGVDCVGASAQQAVDALKDGEVLLLENLRFHPEEEEGDPAFAKQLADLAELYVNDAFSCSHRAHASVVGVSEILPHAAGRLMQEELETLDDIFVRSEHPMAAIIGGAKVSTKLELLEHMVEKVEYLVIGGAMANTFLLAQGHDTGRSLFEPDLTDMANAIMKKAKKHGCEIVLPTDVVLAAEFEAHSECVISLVDRIQADFMILDIGPKTVARITDLLATCKTVMWNGPMGAFEISPFDAGTIALARAVAGLTNSGDIKSIAGGGDTVGALAHAGLKDGYSYLSTAGGAFLEWMEGKPLPGVKALMQ